MAAAFKEILVINVEDGVELDSNAVRVDQIREEVVYGGLRLCTTASISGAIVRSRSSSGKSCARRSVSTIRGGRDPLVVIRNLGTEGL